MTAFQVRHECGVEVEELGVFLHVRHRRHSLTRIGILTNDGVVEEDAGYVEVLSIVGVNHRIGYVGYVATCIGFAGDVDLVVADTKGLLEVGEEPEEVLGDFFLTAGGDFAGAESCTNGILDPGCVIVSVTILLSSWSFFLRGQGGNLIGSWEEKEIDECCLPEHVGQVGPTVRVGNPTVLSPRPLQGPIFL